MEDQALLDLLECPLCYKQLDASAKVLPCQHTFCKPCLQRQEASHSQLLCPECGTPIGARSVEELPANLSLVRLLEGLQGSVGPGRGRLARRYMVPLVRDNVAIGEGQHSDSLGVQHRDRQGHMEIIGSTSFVHGDGTWGDSDPLDNSSRHKWDKGCYYPENSESNGSFPANTIQGVNQTPNSQSLALCRALFDFNPKELNLEDCRDCLTFLKGDILTVIRRVDEHWIEAKLGDEVGIFPLQFTEPNSAAAKLLEGKSRKGSEPLDFRQRIGSGGSDRAADSLHRTAHLGTSQGPGKPPNISTLTLTSQGKQPSSSHYQSTKGQPTSISTLNHLNHHAPGLPSHYSAPPAPPAPPGHAQASRPVPHQGKRSYDSTHRHRVQGERKMNSEAPPTITMALLDPQTASSSADSKHSSTQQLSISVCAALYSYKPRRPEELELRRGEMVGVYGRFKEGWLRGLSLRTGKVGILPGNYVTPVLRTSARLLETKTAPAPSNSVGGKRATAPRNPAVVLSLDRVNTDGAAHATAQGPSVPNGMQHVTSSVGGGKSSHYGTHGWDTVRRVFNPHKGSTQQRNHYGHNSTSSLPSHTQNFVQVQSSGFSPALHRRKHNTILPKPGRPLGWMSNTTAPSAAAILKDSNITSSKEVVFDRQLPSGPHSILVRPDSHKSSTDKPTKSVRFLTEEDSPPPRPRTSSWSSGNQAASTGQPGPPPLEVWAPSLTLGRDGPGIILKEGKAPILRKSMETTISDGLNYNLHKPSSSQPLLSTVSAQFSPSRHRVTTTYLAQTDSELSLLQGESVLVHRPRPDGRILVTQEGSGQTGLFHTSVLQALERLN